MCENRPLFDETIELKDNAMLKHRPDLFNEWDFDKNEELGLDVYKATRGSDKYAWWICPKCISSYESRISNRFNDKKCPYCSGKKVNHTNSLAVLNPSLAKQWHHAKNGNITPNEITRSSNKKVWWECEYGHEWKVSVSDRIKSNCPYCSNKKILKGVNDLWTTHHHIAKMLVNPEIGYKYSYGSDFRTDWKCSSCNNINANKAIHDISNGLSCHFCSDGFKYPEKFMSNLLSLLNIPFVYQKTFTWSQNKVYDFYVPSLNMIIETHGEQHSIRSGFERMGGNTLEKTQANDLLKYRLAIQNKIKSYVVIDCYDSNFDSIKENVLKSILIDFFSFEDNLWEKLNCSLIMYQSKLVEACTIFNSEKITKREIAKRLNISMATLYRYLIKGSEIGLCEYEPFTDESKQISFKKIMKPVVQLSLEGKFINEFNSVSEASRALNASSSSSIGECCRKEKMTSCGFRWMFKDEYIKIIEEKTTIPSIEKKSHRKVIQLTMNGEYINEYNNMQMAMDETGAHRNHIGACCKGRSNHSGGFKWMYKEDYEAHLQSFK